MLEIYPYGSSDTRVPALILDHSLSFSTELNAFDFQESMGQFATVRYSQGHLNTLKLMEVQALKPAVNCHIICMHRPGLPNVVLYI